MSLIKQINYENEIKKKEIYFNLIKLTKQKMILPNDDCFTSFHDKLFDNNDNQLKSKIDCSRSYDFSNFKNKNLITLNNSLFINDPLNDSLQWCIEGGYQSEPKNNDENELNIELFTNSSTNSKISIDQHNSFNDSKFSFHSNQNYNQKSKNLDETLAQMDIETFSRFDMNNLLNGINNKFSTTEDQSIEINNCSIEDSLISEIIDHSNEFKERFNNSINRLKPILNSSYTINSNKLDEISSTVNNESNLNNNDELNDTTINLESVGISVDSLDNSCFEEKCAEVVNKCKTNNKNKYKLTFEQLDDSITESLLNYFQNDLHNVQTEEEKQKTYEHYLQRLKNNEIYLNKLYNDLNRRIKLDKLSKSEYNNDDYKQSSQFKNSLSNDLNNQTNNLSKSLQNNLVNCDDYVPLFNLNNSFNNSSPKNIIKLLNNNDQLNDSNNNNSNNLNSNNSSTKTAKTLILKTKDQQSSNQNNIKQITINTDKSNSSDNQSLTSFKNTTTNDNKQQKIYYNQQTSPIREDDECDNLISIRKEVKKYTNFQNVTAAMGRNQFNNTNRLIDEQDDYDDDFDENIFNSEKLNCPRSISMNDFNSNKRPNLIKQYSLKTTGQQNINSQQQIRSNNSRINRNSKECSLSSGYLSSAGSNNLFIAANIGDIRKNFKLNNNKMTSQQQQLFNQQYACVEDKQVQTSTIYNNEQFSNQHYLSHHQQQTQPILINELPKNCCQNSTHNSPIYVYYPNYSLPDLNFVNNSSIPFQNLHLSPTKFQPPNLDNNLSTRRSSANKINSRYNSKIRPKSCGDFEKLTKEKFKHIQDWESLKTLLPDDIRDLIIRTLNSVDDCLEENDDTNNHSKIMKSKTTSNTPTSHKTFQMAINYNNQSSINSRKDSNTDNSGIRLRQNSKISKEYSLDKNQLNLGSNNKRFSLQEPINNDCMLDCSSTNNSETLSNCSNRRFGMIKSATMNMPILTQQHHRQSLYEQQQKQFQMSRMCYQNLCHSCCNNMSMCHRQQQLMSMGSCCSSCHCSSSNHLNQQQQFNNCCNHHLNNHLEYYQQHYQQQNQFKTFNTNLSAMTSPLKPFNSIIQEENDFESLNCLLENENENGELDFDKLLNCNKEVNRNKTIKLNDKNNQLKNKVTTNLKSKKQSTNTSNGKDNFSLLKNHWEQVSSKTVSSKSTPTTPVTPITQQTKKSIANQPSQQTKRPTSNVVVTRRSQVKSKTVNNNQRRSRSKSPEKSNKEVIILTTKKKPDLPSKPLNTTRTTKDLSKDKQINRTTNSNQSTNKKPTRPNNFNGQQFKSMIPRPTTINRSPPLK